MSDPLFEAARPDCSREDCDQRILRVEQTWEWHTDHGWRLKADAVCEFGHRAPIEPVETP